MKVFAVLAAALVLASLAMSAAALAIAMQPAPSYEAELQDLDERIHVFEEDRRRQRAAERANGEAAIREIERRLRR